MFPWSRHDVLFIYARARDSDTHAIATAAAAEAVRGGLIGGQRRIAFGGRRVRLDLVRTTRQSIVTTTDCRSILSSVPQFVSPSHPGIVSRSRSTRPIEKHPADLEALTRPISPRSDRRRTRTSHDVA